MKTIYVSIASYRDKLCLPTVRSLFTNAAQPDRVIAGICEQNNVNDMSCVDPKYKDRVRIIRLDHRDAKGPAYARFLCSQLYNGEDFYFQIDSHCLFVKNWDTKLIQMLDMIEKKNISKKPILSTYPREYHDYDPQPSDREQITMIKKAFLNEKGILTFSGAEFVNPPKIPQKSYFIAAGFFFSPGAFIKEVPFDPFLDNLFVGEEILLTMRAYTHGWDVFTPNRNIMYHLYTRSDSPKFWDNNYKPPVEAELKVKIITNRTPPPVRLKTPQMIDSLQTYGLGQERSKEDFYHEIHVDTTEDISKTDTDESPVFIIFLVGIIMLITLVLLIVLKKKKS